MIEPNSLLLKAHSVCCAAVAGGVQCEPERGQRLIVFRVDDGHDVVPAWRPVDLPHHATKAPGHFLELAGPLRAGLNGADALIGAFCEHSTLSILPCQSGQVKAKVVGADVRLIRMPGSH